MILFVSGRQVTDAKEELQRACLSVYLSVCESLDTPTTCTYFELVVPASCTQNHTAETRDFHFDVTVLGPHDRLMHTLSLLL